MIPFLEINDTCISCDNCVSICPKNAIIKIGQKYVIEKWACNLCMACMHICPTKSIRLISKQSSENAKLNTDK